MNPFYKLMKISSQEHRCALPRKKAKKKNYNHQSLVKIYDIIIVCNISKAIKLLVK